MLLLLLVFVGVVAVLATSGGAGTGGEHDSERAQGILRQRLAAGEIDPEEYRERAELLGPARRTGPSVGRWLPVTLTVLAVLVLIALLVTSTGRPGGGRWGPMDGMMGPRTTQDTTPSPIPDADESTIEMTEMAFDPTLLLRSKLGDDAVPHDCGQLTNIGTTAVLTRSKGDFFPTQSHGGHGARKKLLVAAAGALALAGCGNGASEAVGQLTEALGNDAAEEAAETEPEPAATEEAEPAAADADEDIDATAPAHDVVTIGERSIETAVHHGGLEYTLGAMTVVDLDADAGGEVEQRVQGLELTFDVSVFNPGNDTMMPSPQVTLRWDEPGTDDVVEVSGRPEFRQVPGNASSSGEIVVQIPPQDLEDHDDATARLVLGRSGQSAAHVAVGDQAETIDRFPVQQPLVGETFDVNGVLVTITAAEVRWDMTNGTHLEDETALFELTYTMENRGSRQSCSTRGSGAFALTLPNGDGIVDLGVTDRCVRGEETITDARTGFEIDADYAGDYTLMHERSDDQAEISFTLIETDGSPADERDTR